MSALAAGRREELLRRSWIANDAFWFYEVARGLGIEQANRSNAAVIRSSARLEVTRALRALGLNGPRSFDEYLRLFRVLADLFLTGTFSYEETAEGDTHRLRVKKCFAYEGVERAGLAKQYHCGPGERALGWFEGLGIPVTVEPPVGLCQMAQRGTCTYAFRPSFEQPGKD
jgi:hypothetical protein